MRKKFVRVMLFGAFALVTATSLVGCKDYDDDIDNLQTQIDANKADIATLKQLVGQGKWVTGISAATNGLTVTMSDGSNQTITGTNGKDGKDGANGSVITIDPTTKNWIIDGTDTGICAQGKDGADGAAGTGGSSGTAGEKGEKGDQGIPGVAPKIVDGNWYVWDAAKADYVDTKVKAGASVWVSDLAENGLAYELTVINPVTLKEETVRLPKAATITSMQAISLDYNNSRIIDASSTYADVIDATTWDRISDFYVWYEKNRGAASVYYSYGVVAAEKGVEFNGVTYEKGRLLVGQNAVLHAVINPVVADIKDYAITLENSKGVANFEIADKNPNKSVEPLTRADATINQGIYDLTLKFANPKADVSKFGYETAYALVTKDVYGNKIISPYDINVYPQKVTWQTNVYVLDVQAKINKDYDMMDNIDQYYKNYIVASKFEIAKTGNNVDKASQYGVTVDGSKITATKAGSVSILLTYMDVTGYKGEFTFIANFTTESVDPAKTNIGAIAWTATDGDFGSAECGKKNSSMVSLADLKDNFTATPNYFGAFVGDLAAVAGVTYKYSKEDLKNTAVTGIDNLLVKKTSKDGKSTYDLYAFFDCTTVRPEAVVATITATDGKIYTVNINVANPNVDDVLKKKAAYFSGSDATAYGTVNATTGKIEYDLYNLFEAGLNKNFVSIKETEFKVGDNVYRWLAKANGTNDGNIVVETYAAAPKWGVNTTREYTFEYAPFGNGKLTKATLTFKLTMKSPIEMGTLTYTGSAITIDAANPGKLYSSAFTGKNVYNVAYDLLKAGTADSDLKSVEFKLVGDDSEKYLEIVDNGFVKSEGTGANIKYFTTVQLQNSTTVFAQDVNCQVKLIVTDKWGTKKEALVTVKIKKTGN